MPVLDCTVKNCLHNIDERCSLDRIRIVGEQARKDQETACSDFVQRREDSCTDSVGMPDIHSIVDCDAEHCVYNEHHSCMASGIGVRGITATRSNETQCGTFHC